MKIINWTDFRTILLDKLERYFDLEITYNNGTHLQAIEFLFEIIRLGDSQPIIEKEEKRGVWEKDVVSCGIVKYICPHCKYSTIQSFNNIFTFNYCPKCGSKNEVIE